MANLVDPENKQFWSQLLRLIEKRRVVPVVGRDLSTIAAPDGSIGETIYESLATQLADEYGVDPDERRIFERVISNCQRLGGQTSLAAYAPMVDDCLTEATSTQPVPQILQQLASIRDFDLFVTTSLDGWMERALAETPGRTGGERSVESLAFSRSKEPDDLPTSDFDEKVSHVYHLFGRAEETPTFAMNEEDVIEYCFDLQSAARPEKLFDRLTVSSLLLIGCRFPDWLGRFFVRLLKNKPLNDCTRQQFLALTPFPEHERFVYFVSANDSHRVLVQDGLDGFVTELAQRWKDARGGHYEQLDEADSKAKTSRGRGKLFISYAREDVDEARSLREALTERGIDAWLDEREIEYGTQWQETIERGIEGSPMCIPLVSQSTKNRLQVVNAGSPPYFAVEWHLAKRRALRYHPPLRYLWPAVLDGISLDDEHIPAEFRGTHVCQKNSGEPWPEDYLQSLQDYWNGIGA